MRTFLIAPAFALATQLLACGPAAPSDERGTASAAESGAPAAPASAALSTFTSDASGFDTHTFWFDTGREVVVFDAQFTPALAEQALASIRAATASPVRYVVITHPNPDKFNGAPVFQAAGAKVVASCATTAALPTVHAYKKHYFVDVAHMFTEDTYPALATVDVTFDGALELPLSDGARVKLVELAHAGVSSTQTVALVPSANALVVGDLVHEGAHAWLEGGIVDGAPKPSLASWHAALGELAEWPDTTAYGGRGVPAKTADAIAHESRYLDEAERVVRAYVSANPSRLDALKQGGTADDAKAIAQSLVAAFPTYTLEYLVEYGVYGLIASIANGG
jgi:glyoxylase-like metal-dependent hydrolase (beta-lactamase superfamily II)